MLNLIKNTYELYFKKLPLLALFVIPLILYSAADSYLKELSYTFVEYQIFVTVSLFLSPFIFTATEIALYKYLMQVKVGGGLGFIKKWAIFVTIHLVMGWIMMLPILILKLFVPNLGMCWIVGALVANIFLGGWIFARVNVILPMIMNGDKLSFKGMWTLGAKGYLPWLLVSALVYFPYIGSYYLIPNDIAQMIIASLLSIVSCVFNSLYYKAERK